MSITCMWWLSDRVLDSRLTRERSGSVVECLTRDREPRVRASPASLRCGPWARHIYPSLVLVQPRKTCPCLNERLLMGRKESNQTNKQIKIDGCWACLPGVSWWFGGSSSRCRGVVCGLWFWYFLIILTYYFWASPKSLCCVRLSLSKTF